jgi:hypothetical protein
MYQTMRMSNHSIANTNDSNLVKKVMVEVEIYGAGESFFIRKDLLCNKSTYFNTALKGEFMEAKTNKFLLVERLDLFQIFHYWLEHGDLDFMDSGDWNMPAEDVLIAFVEIYGFADRRGVPSLGDEILQKLDKRIRPGGVPVRLDVHVINLAWEQLPETCGLCRYLVAIEHDANRCNLPRRSGVEYEWLSGYFTASLLKLADNDSGWWPSATIMEQPVDVAKLHYLVKRNGGWANVDQLSRWGEICSIMRIKAPVGFSHGKLRSLFRTMYVRYLHPWDPMTSPTELSAAEEDCPRSLVKEFFEQPVIIERREYILLCDLPLSLRG